MIERRPPPRRCTYCDERWNHREGTILERNGNLTRVRDEDTGKEYWLAPHEIVRTY